ncbi:MAG: hypothetical protein ACJAUP_003467 [Cellvibrionaceae bacterium]|jgi:hypothetical protein
MVKKREPALTFLKKVLLHVLPKGFHCVRDYGMLNCAARMTLKKAQLLLRVIVRIAIEPKKITMLCPCCGEIMCFCGFIKPHLSQRTI